VDEKSRPSLQRIHADEILEKGIGRVSLEYWRQRSIEEIVESLRPGKNEALKVKLDGRIFNGNVRIKILEERGFDINSLERELA
jgi:hypothetical protein